MPFNTAIILQARMGSSRLPGKMNLPFFEEKTVPEIIIEELKRFYNPQDIIVATTVNKADDVLVEMARKKDVRVYRGSEDDVLDRFLHAARKYNYEALVRIPADNPFLSSLFIRKLLAEIKPQTGYASYRFPDGTPVMKSHIGLFPEWVRTETLEKVARLTEDPAYREHVTNYIYEHPERFNIRWLEVPKEFQDKNIRLTMDTPEDFALLKEIYRFWKTSDKPDNIYFLFSEIKKRPSWLKIMRNEIERNQK